MARHEVDTTLIKERSKQVQFTNFSRYPFRWTHEGDLYEFQPGETAKMELFKADLFAKHLVDTELIRIGARTNELTRRKQMLYQCIQGCDISELDDPVNRVQAVVDKDKVTNVVITNDPPIEQESIVTYKEPEKTYVKSFDPWTINASERGTEKKDDTDLDEVKTELDTKQQSRQRTTLSENEQKALQMREDGEHWKVVEKETGIKIERQKELIMNYD